MLPSADFNKKVYEFDESKYIWNQEAYTCRVKTEADMLVTLEALKTSVRHLHLDLDEL